MYPPIKNSTIHIAIISRFKNWWLFANDICISVEIQIKSRIHTYIFLISKFSVWYFLINFQDWIPERRHELIKQYKIRGIENEDDIAFNLTKDVTDEYYSRYFFDFWNNGILFLKLFWPTVRKNCSSDREKFWTSRLKAKNLQKFCSNSERSEQFLVTECFFNLFLEVSHI